MKSVELFEYLDLLKNRNMIENIPMDELKAILTGKSSDDFALVTDCIYFMVFDDKNTKELIKVQCVKNYYNLDIQAPNGKLKCFNIKKEFENRDIPNCIPENCAKCHACCIEDFFNGKITKK